MALPPLPPESTERWFLDYTVQDVQHALMMRTVDEADPAVVVSYLDAFLVEMTSLITPLTPIALRRALRLSNVTVPQDMSGLQTEYGTGLESPINIPLQGTFTGRSNDGRKTRVGIFGITAQNDTSWRKTPTEEAALTNVIAVLAGASQSGYWVTISGQRAFWHPYMNLGYNDHFVKKARIA